MSEGKQRPVPLFVALAIMAICAVLGSRITLDNDISRLLPDSSPEMTRASRALKQLMNRTVIDVAAEDESIDLERLALVADTLAERLTASGHVFRVRARMNADDVLPVIDLLRNRAPLLMGASALREIEAAIKPDTAVATIQELALRIQQLDGGHLKARAPIDPLGITDRVLAPLSALGESFGATRLIDGRITTTDGKHLLIIVEVKCAPNDTEKNDRYLTDLQKIITSLHADPENAGVRIRFSGAHRATLDNVRQIQSDVFLTTTIGISFVALLAILCFGRIWLGLLALTPALFGGVCAWGVFSLFQDTTSGAVLGFGAVLLGLTIDFAVHVLFRLDRSGDEGKKVTLPLRALYMGGTTTSLAFVALQASSLPALRDVGTFGAIGIFAAVLFAIYVLPTLVRRPKRAKPIVDLQKIVTKLARPSFPVMIIAIVLTPIFAIGCLFLEFDGDPTNLSALTPAAADDDHTIHEVWGRSRQNTALVVEHEDLPTALAANDRLSTWLDERVSTGIIRRHGSISGLLPSPETQRNRLQAWREFWTDDRVRDLRGTLDRATAESIFAEGTFTRFVDWIGRTPETLTYEKEVKGPMQLLLADRIDLDEGVWRITTPVFADTWEQIAALETQLGEDLPEVTLLNRQAFARKLASMVTGEVGLLGIIAFLLVGTVVFMWHGRWLITFAILLPLLLSLVWTLGLLGWFGIPISLANAIFVVLLFGVAVDYAIFLASSRLDRFRTGVDRVPEAQASVLLCTLTTCGGFGSLAAAGHPVMHSIGLTALIGIFSAALTTQIFVPVLTSALLRRGGPNGTPGIPNVRAGFWAFRMMVVRGMWHMLTNRKGSDEAASQRAAIDCIRDMGLRIHRLKFGRRTFVDEEKILQEPCVFVANHESMYDIMAALALPRPTQLLVKGWVWNMPVMGHMIKRAGYILAQETDPDEVLAEARKRIENGNSVLVFPEGKRTRTGRIGRFHNGAFAIARSLGVKVQPLAMVNTREVVPHKAWWMGDHDAKMCVLDPMDPRDFEGDDGDRRMAREARNRVRDRCNETWLQTQFGPRWFAVVGGMYRYLGPLVTHYAISKCKRDPLIRELPNLCPGHGPILVAGGGLGLMTSRLALAFPQRPITCLDIDERKLQIAKAALGGRFPVEFVLADLRTTELPRVELALLIDVLHYWDSDTQKQILRQVSKSLAPGGSLLLRDGCDTGDKRHKLLFAQEFFSVMCGFTRNQGKFLFRSEAGWRTVLEECGFDVEESREDLGTLSNVVLVCKRTGDVFPEEEESRGEAVSK